MTRSELHAALESIFEMQPYQSFILAGFHLTPDQLKHIQADLEPDDPNVGAIGRYHRVPVFLADSATSRKMRKRVSQTKSFRGVRFSYVQLDVVN